MSKPLFEPATAESESLLEHYEALRDYMRVMRRYADAKDWEHLIGLQTAFVQVAEELASAERTAKFSQEQTERKLKLATEIRDAESAVHERLEERLRELSARIDETRRGSRASRAYRASNRL